MGWDGRAGYFKWFTSDFEGKLQMSPAVRLTRIASKDYFTFQKLGVRRQELTSMRCKKRT